MQPVDIIIPAFNQLRYCQQCVESIQRSTDVPYRLVLIDNGSTDGVSEYFDGIPGAHVLHAPTNLGFAGGVNLGLRDAQGHVVLLNSDTVVPPRWLERLLAVLESDPKIGVVGPLSNYASGMQQIETPELSTQEELATFADDLAAENAGMTTNTFRLVGFCMLIRDETLRRVGLFDERFGTGNFEDDDYCLRVRQAGYRLVVAHDAFVYHFGNRTFVGMGLSNERFSEVLQENEKRFREKWGRAVEEHSAQALDAEALNAQARSALEAQDLELALRLQTQAVELHPRSARHHNDLGVILWKMDERLRARTCFERALRLDAEYEDARANLDVLTDELERHG